MPATPHIEKLFMASESVRDVVIGMADGLTVCFAQPSRSWGDPAPQRDKAVKAAQRYVVAVFH
jgi:hypothetical protein